MKQNYLQKILIIVAFLNYSLFLFAGGFTSAQFYGKKAEPTPSGAGQIYVYHAKAGVLQADGYSGDKKITDNQNDTLLAPENIVWIAVEKGSEGLEIEVSGDVDKYGGDGFIYAAQSGSKVALDVYFFAKPNPGFRFLGWSSESSGATEFLAGSKRKYTLYSKNAKTEGAASSYSTWNNEETDPNITWAAKGHIDDEEGGYDYVRHVHELSSSGSVSYYAYFEMIPQTFSFGGTGNEATYTASSGENGSVFNYSVGTADREGVSAATAQTITLTLTPNSYNRALYKFAGWYYDYTDQSGRHTQNLLSTSTTATYKLSSTETADATWNKNVATWSNVKIYPLFVDLRFANFCVGLTGCQTLEQAIAAVTDSDDKTILVIKNYTVPEGNYTIPEGVTLLIPYAVDQEIPATVLPRVENENATAGNAYRTLTLSSGVHLDVYGTIEVGGRQATGVTGAGGEEGIGCPTGDYGCLYMGTGSSITLNNGALLRGWGYVLGDYTTVNDTLKYQCEIDARRGSRVQEQFQMMDWKGGTYTMGMTDGLNSNVDSPTSHRVLPINQYYIQNVEVPVKYRPGAKLQANASVFLNGEFYGIPLNNVTLNIDNVGVIGARYNDPDVKDDEAIFLMDNEDDSEDTWVRKYYDVANDKQVYEINNAASLGSLVLTILGIPVSSTEYKLPITNNFKIHLLNGNMAVTQHTEFLAGSELIANKKSTITIPQGVNVYLYDKDNWGNYISTTRNGDSSFSFGVGTTVKWRPGGRPTVRREAGVVKIEDTKFTISGTLDVHGGLFTTSKGATIISSVEDAGTIIFSADAPANSTVSQVISLPANSGHDNAYTRIPCTSAQLMNEDGTLTQTYTDADHHALSGQSYCFIDFDGNGKGEWKALATNGCIVKDEDNVYYIKPQEYVSISQDAAPVEEADHTYRDHYTGTGRIFIQAAEGDCQWWEVRAVSGHPDLFECINENNHTFYYYDESAGNWMEKKFKVSWVNWDGTPVNYTNKEDQQVNYYMVTYGTVPEWLSANPKHVDDASHTYSFKGWLPTPAAVTEDVTYTAQYEERDRMYAITFNDEGDKLIQLVYCKLGEIPACTKYDAAANNKVWKTAGGEAIGAVAGDVTYKLYEKESKDSYTIRFVNWNGDPLQSSSVAAGVMPSAPANPTKASDDLHSYSFKSWNPALANADADATYTATYNVGPRGYTVLWKNGETTIETDENVLYGTVPEYNGATPTQAGHTFVGWSPAVAAVTGAATYTAQFLENRTITNGQTISTNTEVSTITVETTGALTINNKTLTAETLILKSASDASGQLIPTGSNPKINATNAYYDLTLGSPEARHWNAFGVPWVVNLDVTPLVELNNVGEPVGTLVLGRDYDIVFYNGAKRAAQGAGYWCWEFLEHHVHNLTPGKGYMIQFIKDVKGIRFTKVSGTDFFYQGTVDLDENASAIDVNNGWNAMSNPMPFHANMTNGPTVGYVHNGGEIGNDGYVKYNLAGKFIVGKTVYVQAGAGGDEVSPVYASSGSEISPASLAPMRRTSATDKKYMALEDYYTVVISDAAGNKGGDISVLPEEDKENKYVIGHDLAQFGMSTAIPQVWVNRYDTKLALNTTALFNETAEFPMGVYAPTAGEYTISLNAQPSDEYNVYLTRDGQAIWNLSDGAFTADLKAGIQSNYGLRLTLNKAPQVVTGVDEAIVNANGETRKVMINNQVYIIRGEQVYTIDGQLVK